MSLAYKELSDNKLLEECAKDNLKAFNTLFDRYSGKLYNYALRYVKDENLAEEAMMDLMFWVWDKRQTLKLEGEFQPYIFRAMKNATIKVIRKKAIITAPIESIENNTSFIAVPADHRLYTKEISAQYIEKLNQLSPQRKRVFQMSREDDLSHAEIAGNLNISINTVKNHIKASLSHFRGQFNEHADTIIIFLIGISLFYL